MKVDEFSRSSVPHIYAVGDVTERISLTPVALMEGMAFAKTVFGGQDTPVDHANVSHRRHSCPPPRYNPTQKSPTTLSELEPQSLPCAEVGNKLARAVVSWGQAIRQNHRLRHRAGSGVLWARHPS